MKLVVCIGDGLVCWFIVEFGVAGLDCIFGTDCALGGMIGDGAGGI